jgi:hypothetical protein
LPRPPGGTLAPGCPDGSLPGLSVGKETAGATVPSSQTGQAAWSGLTRRRVVCGALKGDSVRGPQSLPMGTACQPQFPRGSTAAAHATAEAGNPPAARSSTGGPARAPSPRTACGLPRRTARCRPAAAPPMSGRRRAANKPPPRQQRERRPQEPRSTDGASCPPSLPPPPPGRHQPLASASPVGYAGRHPRMTV